MIKWYCDIISTLDEKILSIGHYFITIGMKKIIISKKLIFALFARVNTNDLKRFSAHAKCFSNKKFASKLNAQVKMNKFNDITYIWSEIISNFRRSRRKILLQLCSKEHRKHKCIRLMASHSGQSFRYTLDRPKFQKKVGIIFPSHTHTQNATQRTHIILCECEEALVKMKLDVTGILFDYIRSEYSCECNISEKYIDVCMLFHLNSKQ